MLPASPPSGSRQRASPPPSSAGGGRGSPLSAAKPARNSSAPSLTALERAGLESALAKLPNKNRPSDYKWMEAMLSLIALNTAPAVTDLATRATGAPLFAMAGACPSTFAGMQAVVFTAMWPANGASSGERGIGSAGTAQVDYWWLKPRSDSPGVLEEMTLQRHAKGPHKNDPGQSKKVYGPIANLFSKRGTSSDGKLRFGLVDSGTRPRAFIECVASGARYVVCWVWLEDWSSPVSFGKKFMKGKLIYQKTAGHAPYFARPFKFVDGLLLVPPGDALEDPLDAVMPPDRIKLGCDV